MLRPFLSATLQSLRDHLQRDELDEEATAP